MSSSNCLLCGGQMRIKFRGLFDDRYGHPGRFDIAECTTCGFMSTEPRLRDTDLPDLYATYYPRSKSTAAGVRAAAERSSIGTSSGRWRARFVTGNRAAHHEISPGMRVLDYGCGDCVSLLEIRALGGDPYGIEVDPNVRELAESLGVRVHVGTIETLPEADESFDAVTLSQVIEHVTDPEALLREIGVKLKRGGRLVLTTPNSHALTRRLTGRRWLHWHLPFHQNHYHAKVLRDLLTRLGYRVDRWATFTPQPWWEYQLELLLRPSEPGVPHPYFDRGESSLLTSRTRERLVRIGRLAAIVVARLVDFVRMGDSLLIVATRT